MAHALALLEDCRPARALSALSRPVLALLLDCNPTLVLSADTTDNARKNELELLLVLWLLVLLEL